MANCEGKNSNRSGSCASALFHCKACDHVDCDAMPSIVAAPGIDSLIKRASLFLEDEDYEQAHDYFQKVLDIDPEYAPAYAGLACVAMRCSRESDLRLCEHPLIGNTNFDKAIRFSNETYRKKLESYNTDIVERIGEARRLASYNELKSRIDEANSAVESCAHTSVSVKNWVETYDSLARHCDTLKGYKDSELLMEKCNVKSAELNSKISALLETEERQRKAHAKYAIITVATIIFLYLMKTLITGAILPYLRYNQGKAFLSQGSYLEAIKKFQQASGYKDAKTQISSAYYLSGEELLARREYTKAISEFKKSGNYKDAKTQISSAYYLSGEELMAQREYAKAISEFKKLGNYKDAKEQINNAYYYIAESLLLQLNYADTDATIQKAKTNGPVRFSTIIEMYQSIAHCASAIAVGQHHAIGLKADGTVVATGKNDEGQLNVRSWRDIVAVSAAGNHTVGLKADGTVVATGDNSLGQINVGGWREIIAISNERFNCLGLKADGTVVSTRSLGTEAWHDIVAISRTAGLKNDGTVVSIKGTYFEVDAWRDVVAIAENSFHLVGLRADGTVVATGRNDEGQLNVESWRDIVAISAGTYDTFGIKADGTVMAARKHDSSSAIIWNDIAKKWSDIVAISAGLLHAVGLKADGTVVGVGFWLEDRLEINDWRNIKAGTPFSYNREN